MRSRIGAKLELWPSRWSGLIHATLLALLILPGALTGQRVAPTPWPHDTSQDGATGAHVSGSADLPPFFTETGPQDPLATSRIVLWALGGAFVGGGVAIAVTRMTCGDDCGLGVLETIAYSALAGAGLGVALAIRRNRQGSARLELGRRVGLGPSNVLARPGVRTPGRHRGARKARQDVSAELERVLGEEDTRGPLFRVEDMVRWGDHLWIADAGNHRLVRVGDDPTSVGQEGKGPGDYNRPTDLAVSQGRLVVWDRGLRRLTFLDAQGRVDSTWSLPSRSGESSAPTNVFPLPDGALALSSRSLRGVAEQPEDFSSATVARVHEDGTADTLEAFPPFGPVTMTTPLTDGRPGFRRTVVIPITNGRGLIDRTPACGGVSIVSVDPVDLRLLLYRDDGSMAEQTLPISGPPITEAEAAAYLDRLPEEVRDLAQSNLPRRHSPITRLAVTSAARVWMRTRDETGQGVRWIVSSVADLWSGDPDGSETVSVFLPEEFVVYEEHEGLVWGVARDDLGVETIRAYRTVGPMPSGCP